MFDREIILKNTTDLCKLKIKFDGIKQYYDNSYSMF